MRTPHGVYILFIIQLSLTAGSNADGGAQRDLFRSGDGNRPDAKMTPPGFDPKLSGPLSAGPQGQAQSKHLRVTKTSDPPLSLCESADGPRSCIKDTNFTEMLYDQEYVKCREDETKKRHQTVVMMEDDPAVIQSATYLFERNPTESTLLTYHKGALRIYKGVWSSFNGHHELVLVGHGSVGTNGSVLSGYHPEELAQLVTIVPGQLCSITIVSCNTGKDLLFVSRLLQVLKSVGVKVQVHLYNSFLSVTVTGQILTQMEGVWRTHDHRRRVIVTLDGRRGLIMRGQLGCAGPTVPGYMGNVLYLQVLEWPRHPQMFVPRELRKKYPSIDCLEGLTWSLFFETERRRAPDYVPQSDYKEAVWLMEPGPEEHIIIKHINDIQDLLVEIRYNAREEVSSDLYYVLNECIYKVQRRSLNVTLVGKFMSNDSKAEIENFRQQFNGPQGESTLQELRQGLKPSKFNDFCRQTFQYQQCNYNCERWGRYFMAAVFSTSVLNFRTFSLFLMSVIGCEVGRSRGTDSPLCTAFVGLDHPMETEKPRPGRLRRGFYGCTVENYGMAPQESQVWLDEVVAKENALYTKSKQMMMTVDHDEQTELDIFGRVKVMNKYVFSSYLEFFRGTPEGRKLKRGCAPSFNNNSKP